MWFWWALPRFYPAQEADKHAGLQAHEQVPAPPEEKPRALISGGEWANVPPAAEFLPDPGVDPKPAPVSLFAPPTGLFWPVRNPKHHTGRTISFVDVNDKGHGNVYSPTSGCHFLANRPAHGTADRFHGGVDVLGDKFDVIVACEAGKVVNLYWFYPPKKPLVKCLIVQCDSGVVINYGEIEPDSPAKYHIKIGSTVQPGQPIAEVGRMTSESMLHFETYPSGTKHNVSLFKKEGEKLQKLIWNPTQYLLALATKGK
jgi:murein DD-endopeptidase MepM/ murein hydrolase activator NlpD